jgi:hypothetical protein
MKAEFSSDALPAIFEKRWNVNYKFKKKLLFKFILKRLIKHYVRQTANTIIISLSMIITM